MLENFFHLKENGTTVRTEVLAGLTTFMTMAYIIVANPMILGNSEFGAGMDKGSVAVATCLASAVAILVMGLLANYPFALAPGMGINAFFSFTVCGVMGVPWQTALGLVFLSGVLFFILTIFKTREVVINAIPLPLKAGVSGGIGLFLAFIGLQQAGLIAPQEATLVTISKLTRPEVLPKVLLATIGLLVMSVLYVRRVRGAILISILLGTLLHFIPFFHSNDTTRVEIERMALGETFFQLDIISAIQPAFWVLIFTFLFVDFFDTAGTLVGLSSAVGVSDEKGRIPRVGKALFADATGTVVGSLLGTSTVTSYIESAAGIEEGGKTGLTAVVVALLFLIAVFMTPLVGIVPEAAVAPALILVGIMMMGSIRRIALARPSESIPSFLILIVMPLTFSITNGIAVGFLVYTLIQLLSGKGREVHPIMYILSVLFIVFFIWSPMFR
jgi:AGZA family xanthine/uracil permease-like MFS transporter